MLVFGGRGWEVNGTLWVGIEGMRRFSGDVPNGIQEGAVRCAIQSRTEIFWSGRDDLRSVTSRLLCTE